VVVLLCWGEREGKRNEGRGRAKPVSSISLEVVEMRREMA